MICHGQLELDPVRYRVRKCGRTIHLTPKEFEVLRYLMINAGKPIPRARLLSPRWEEIQRCNSWFGNGVNHCSDKDLSLRPAEQGPFAGAPLGS